MTIGELTVVGVLSAICGWAAGLWSSTFMQDREMRRRHLGIVRALEVEVMRILEELGPEVPTFSAPVVASSGVVVPQLGSWTIQLLSDLAASDAQPLAGFLRLERYLHNLATFQPQRTKMLGEIEARAEEAKIAAGGTDVAAATLAQKGVEQSEDGLKLIDAVGGTQLRLARLELTAIRKKLAELREEFENPIRTHLP